MNKLEQPCAETGAAVSAWRETVDRIVPAMGPVDEAEYPAEWVLFMDRTRIRQELLALSPPPPSSHDGLREDGSASVAGAESEPCGLRTETPAVAGWVSACCAGEVCFCGAPAARKVGEEIFSDDPTAWTEFSGHRVRARHNLTRYVCFDHFVQIMGPAALRLAGDAS